MFTDGYLEGDEKMFPEEADIIRNDSKLIFFHLIELVDKKLSLEAMVNTTKHNKNVIAINKSDMEKTSNQLHSLICDQDQVSKKNCKPVPEKETYKCQLNVLGGCFQVCEEKYCECDEMYPWDPCPLTCGDGVTTKKVLNTSSCEVETDCHAEPCSTKRPLISGPLDLVIVLDESKSFRKWHSDKRKIV